MNQVSIPKGNQKIKYIAVALVFTIFINISSLSFAFAANLSSDIVSSVNSTRQGSGLSQLTVNDKLTAAAQVKANDMFSKGYFAHVSPDGKQPWDFITSAGYNYVFAGENLAIGYNDTQEVMTAWMNSPTHRENILNPNYREIGIATQSGTYEGAQTTIIVQEFGSLTEQVAGTSVANNSQEFTIVTDKSNFSPAKVFAGGEVTFNAVISGDASDINIMVGDQKITFAAPTQDGANKIYITKANIEKAGDFDVTLNITDKWGNKESKVLGKLTVAEKVVSKASIVREDGGNNLVYILLASVMLMLGIGGYLVFRFQKKQHKFA